MACGVFDSSKILSQMLEELEDAVAKEFMCEAVTIIPCGHVLNKSTVLECINGCCPLDRVPMEGYMPNYTIRNLAQIAKAHPQEASISKAAPASSWFPKLFGEVRAALRSFSFPQLFVNSSSQFLEPSEISTRPDSSPTTIENPTPTTGVSPTTRTEIP